MDSCLFKGVTDRYNGITVNSQQEPCNESDFLNKLSNSMKQWLNDNRRCIWFNVNIKDSVWIPILAKEGFNFHHSKDNFVMMYKWLPMDSSSNLPPACHTNLGVGGLVFNDKNQVLVVREQHVEHSHWKFPGGYVERGEDIKDAAIREVKEETGIDTEFNSFVTLRHTHKMMFGNSDIYIVVTLKATSDIINKCDKEINACEWMDIEEYLTNPEVIDFNKDILKQAIDSKKRNLKMNFSKASVSVGKFTREYSRLVFEDL